jgi:flagellar biosynthesis/type III secretory pathway chaperone
MSASTSLAEVLDREADVYESLLALLHEEEAALIAGNASAVGNCLARTETLVLQLRLLENSRETLVTQLTGRRDTRLRELPEPTAGPLGRARARLEATLPRVEAMNTRVTALLHRALRLFDTTLDLIREAAGLNRQYTAGGALTHSAQPMIDGRA